MIAPAARRDISESVWTGLHNRCRPTTATLTYAATHPILACTAVTVSYAGAASSLGSEQITFVYTAGRWYYQPSDLSIYKGHDLARPWPPRRSPGSADMEDTWAGRDLPVLDAVVAALEEDFRVTAAQIAAATGIPADDVVKAFYALQGTYTGQVQTRLGGGPNAFFLNEVTADARRAVGQWPTAESIIEKLASGIAQAAERESDPEQGRRMLAVAQELGGAMKGIAANVASDFLEHRLLR
jgi:hypothetical protein